MKDKTVTGLKAIAHILGPPDPANQYVANFFNKKGINPTQVAKLMNVSPSTVKRFLDGGALTVSMAANLGVHYNLPVKLLFKLEAVANAYQAEELMKLNAKI